MERQQDAINILVFFVNEVLCFDVQIALGVLLCFSSLVSS